MQFFLLISQILEPFLKTTNRLTPSPLELCSTTSRPILSVSQKQSPKLTSQNILPLSTMKTHVQDKIVTHGSHSETDFIFHQFSWLLHLRKFKFSAASMTQFFTLSLPRFFFCKPAGHFQSQHEELQAKRQEVNIHELKGACSHKAKLCTVALALVKICEPKYSSYCAIFLFTVKFAQLYLQFLSLCGACSSSFRFPPIPPALHGCFFNQCTIVYYIAFIYSQI